SAPSVATGTSNVAGTNLAINGSKGTGTGVGGAVQIKTAPVGASGVNQNTLQTRLSVDGPGNVIVGNAALATTATNGFLYIPTCAGSPTGTPTSYTGNVPLIFDTADSKIYVYTGSTWKATAALS
ncbi:MAG: hypothetical protein ACREHG_09085, partial [Candidatus Saccharimonadales bacterium]